MDRYITVSMANDLTGSGAGQTLIVDTAGGPAAGVVVAVVKNDLAVTVAAALNGA